MGARIFVGATVCVERGGTTSVKIETICNNDGILDTAWKKFQDIQENEHHNSGIGITGLERHQNKIKDFEL